MGEYWKDISGYEGLYQVSTMGRIRRNGRIKIPHKDKGGYLTVWLSKDSVQRNFKVHRLVAQAFLPNPENKKTVNHIDGNKTHNCLDNLEWATHSENVTHAVRLGLRTVTDAQRKAARETGKRTCDKNRQHKAVACYLKVGGVGVEFESAHEAARSVNGSASAIIKCCKGKAMTHKGYYWRYV